MPYFLVTSVLRWTFFPYYQQLLLLDCYQLHKEWYQQQNLRSSCFQDLEINHRDPKVDAYGIPDFLRLFEIFFVFLVLWVFYWTTLWSLISNGTFTKMNLHKNTDAMPLKSVLINQFVSPNFSPVFPSLA